MLTVAFACDPHALPTAGIPRYMRTLEARLAARTNEITVRPFTHHGWADPVAIADPTGATSTGSVVAPLSPLARLKSRIARVPGVMRAYRAAKEPAVRALLDGSGADVYHEPHFVPWPTRLPTVVTIHDLSVFVCPQYHPADRVALLRREIPRAAARAQHIITLSETMKRALVATLGVPPDQVSAIPIGIDPVFHVREPAVLAPALARVGLMPGRYLLFVGTLEPRKNLIGALEALDMLPPAVVRACPLVVIGSKGWRDGPVTARLDRAVRAGLAVQLGSVPDALLAAAYAGARGVVFPSFYEGQGLPALEAAVSGVPVITTTSSPMEELLGSHALYAPAGDDQALAAGIARLIEDDDLSVRARRAASGLAADFHWDHCIERTVAAYHAALR